ncbi:hypothetical protein J2785_005594 [Burkholderia ambifaria]|nr:hypothetical protein [Burkholderia ambifaria]
MIEQRVHVMKTTRPVPTIFIEQDTDRLRTRCFVNRPLARAGAIRTNVAAVSPYDAAPFAPHAPIVDPFVEQAQREALDDTDLCTLDFMSCTLITSLVTLQAREPTALETTRQADHLPKQQRRFPLHRRNADCSCVARSVSAHSGIARQQPAQTRRFNSCPAPIAELKRHCQLFRPPDIRIPLFTFFESHILPTQRVIIAIAFSIEHWKTAKTLLTSTFP